MPKRILILTNMGPTRQNPYQGMFVFRQADALREKLSTDDLIRVFSMPSWLGSKPSWFKYPIWFCWFLLTQSWRRYTHLHVHFFMPTAWLAIVYKKLHKRSRLYATFHGTDIYAYMPPSKRYVQTLGYFEQLIFVSRQLKNRLSDYVRSDRMTILSAGIPDLFVPPDEASERTTDYLFVGNLNHNKGGDRLVKFARQLPQGKSLVIAGEGEYRTELEGIARRNPLVKVAGAQTARQLLAWYQDSRWLLSLSRNESFGLVMTEAMACGTPVLATETDGACEQLVNGENGYVITQQAADQLDQVVTLSNVAPQEWQQLSEGAITAAQAHRLNTVVKTLVKFYS